MVTKSDNINEGIMSINTCYKSRDWKPLTNSNGMINIAHLKRRGKIIKNECMQNAQGLQDGIFVINCCNSLNKIKKDCWDFI